ncbi:unnamed protein product [Cochlearia groenlandica]
MGFNTNAHPGCVYADNPFHECASACLDRIAQGHGKKNIKKQSSKILSFSGSFGRKKKESHSQQLSPPTAKPYQKAVSGFVNANSPKFHHSIPPPHVVAVNKKLVSESNKSFTSSSSSEHPVSPKPKKQEHNLKIEVSRETRIFSFLSPPRSHDIESNDDDDNDEDNNEIGVDIDDLESVKSETFVSVGKYIVRSGSSTILSDIIEKHGDIAQDCKLESDSMRSRYLECLCSLMKELKSTPIKKLTKLKVKEMLAIVKDLEKINIEVSWIRLILEEFSRFQEDEESEKEKQEELVKAKREELEAEEEELIRMEEEVEEARLRIEEARAKMVEIERSRMEKMGFKMEKFKGRSFIGDLM